MYAHVETLHDEHLRSRNCNTEATNTGRRSTIQIVYRSGNERTLRKQEPEHAQLSVCPNDECLNVDFDVNCKYMVILTLYIHF